MYDLQKANSWKRISAALCDVILLSVLAVGVAFLLSVILGYNTYYERLEAAYDKYEQEYGVSFDDMNSASMEEISDEEQSALKNAYEALIDDDEVQFVLSMLLNLTLIIITFGILIAYLALEFFVPLAFKNGQTVGKKIFGIGVMREDGVKLSTVQLFARTVLGKFTIETMVPVLIIIMIMFGIMGIFGTVIIIGLLFVQLVMFAVTPARSLIHDKLARTVTVDMASQMIFDTPEELLAYKKKAHEARVQSADDSGRMN